MSGAIYDRLVGRCERGAARRAALTYAYDEDGLRVSTARLVNVADRGKTLRRVMFVPVAGAFTASLWIEYRPWYAIGHCWRGAS